jgi:hypothetical protein
MHAPYKFSQENLSISFKKENELPLIGQVTTKCI